MDPLTASALTALVPKIGVLTSIVWKMLADPTALADPRAMFEVAAVFVEKGGEVITGTKELLTSGQVELSQRIQARVEREFGKLSQSVDLPANQTGQIASAVEDALTFLARQPLDRTEWLKANLNPKHLAERLVQACEESVQSFKGNGQAHQVMLAICEIAFDELTKHQPEANKVQMAGTGILLEGQEKGDQKLDQVLLSQSRIEALLAQKAEANGVPVAVFDELLKRLFAKELDFEKLQAQIEGIVKAHREQVEQLKAEIQALKSGPAGQQSSALDLMEQALPLVEAGLSAQAEALLKEADELMTSASQDNALRQAKMKSIRAKGFRQLNQLQEAGLLLQEAADLVRFNKVARFAYLIETFDALYDQGREQGDNSGLVKAIDRARKTLEEFSYDKTAQEYLTAQFKLGNALCCLGERESGTARLDEAVAAYREALKEWTREREPLDWATTQNNLGVALFRLGERESGTARLDEAVAAYREALKERARERVPLDWAATQNNLGNALLTLGQRESSLTRLNEAVVAYREALKECARERMPLDWATIKNNIGIALFCSGEREPGTVRLEDAVAAFREALKERTRKRVPLDWASTQNNLGNALLILGQSESGTTRLDAAVVAYREALAVFETGGASHYVALASGNVQRLEALIALRR